jgi:hypothetical protein
MTEVVDRALAPLVVDVAAGKDAGVMLEGNVDGRRFQYDSAYLGTRGGRDLDKLDRCTRVREDDIARENGAPLEAEDRG